MKMSFYQDIETKIYVNNVLTNCTFSFHYQESEKPSLHNPGEPELFVITGAIIEPVENMQVDLFKDEYFWLFEGNIDDQLKESALEYLGEHKKSIEECKAEAAAENMLFMNQAG